MRKSSRFLLLPILFASSSNRIPAADQTQSKSTSGPLFEAIARMDRHLCAVFNAHNVDRLMEMATKDLEFYEDTDGLKGYQQCYDEFKKLFAGNEDLRREVVDGTIEVYPIKDYGAIEVGQHRFCQRENGREECGTFKFTMLWQKSDDSWKIARVINYGQTNSSQ
jgi:ketosteroid isomerase-like protein